MAELIHSKHRESESQVGVSEKLDMMMRELHNLRNQVNEQSIQLDDMRNAKSVFAKCNK
ncbi:MAG: hypothetical protein R2688_05635 [Fimbriimonadaceae bacterium]